MITASHLHVRMHRMSTLYLVIEVLQKTKKKYVPESQWTKILTDDSFSFNHDSDSSKHHFVVLPIDIIYYVLFKTNSQKLTMFQKAAGQGL